MNLRKYFEVFKISLSQEFAYKFNFIMWRVRNVLLILLVFFLWDAIFRDPERIVFGYTRAQMFSYAIGLVVVRAVVLSTKARGVSSDIADGKLSMYLVKPLSYFKFYLASDLSTKFLNFSFSILETILLVILFKPEIFVQKDIFVIFLTIVSLILASLIFFLLSFVISLIPFWKPELGWGGHFLFDFIFTEFLSGALFPLDILPVTIQKFLSILPFQYMVYFPLKVYLGGITGLSLFKGVSISLIWVIGLYFFMKYLWSKGLKAYEGHGQ